MSDDLIGVLVGGFISIATLLITQIFNLWAQSREHEERYRLTLYEKRLAAHQEAFNWTQKLGVAANDIVPGQLDTPEAKQLDREVRAAARWWNANALYLDPVSMSEVVKLRAVCIEWARGNIEKKDTITEQIETAQRAIVKGIGLKHIDFKDIKADVRKMREENDAQ